MLKKFLILTAVAAFVLTGCRSSAPPDRTAADDALALRSFYVGLAALEVGDNERAKIELSKTVELAPREAAAWNNLAVLQLRQKDYEAAVQSFEEARALAPANASVNTNLATAELRRGNFDRAIEHLEKAIELDPRDARAVYALAQEKERQTKDAEALALCRRIVDAAPDNLAARLETARLAAKIGDGAALQQAIGELRGASAAFPPEAKTQFAALEAAAGNARQAATEISYLRNLLVREPLFRASLEEIKPPDAALGELLRKPLELAAPDFAPAAPDAALSFAPEAAAEAKAVFATAVALDGDGAPALAWSNESETRVGPISLPVAAADAEQMRAFDFDYDFKNDLAFATKNGFRLFRQTDGGNFADATAAAGLSPEIARKAFAGVWTFDAESDGDLDLILGAETGPPVVLQNNGDGSFAEVKIFGEAENLRDFVAADFDEDGDADAVVLDESGRIRCFSNERGGIFRERSFPNAKRAAAVAVGDADGDGKLDLIALANDGTVTRYSDAAGADWQTAEIFKTAPPSSDAAPRLTIADFDNNGALDALLSNRERTLIFLAGADGKFIAEPINVGAARVSAVADANGDGKLDLFGLDVDGRTAIFRNQSAKNYHWQILRPRAARTEGDQRVNSFGIGGEIEIRAGLAAQKRLIDAPQIHFGLGEAATADVLRVVWGNGYVQAEFDLKSDQAVLAEQRLKGSCPHLFAWNGEQFALVKDAPPWSPALGLKINAQETYGVLQTEEWFKIPGESLRARAGFYELRITGEYWESFYLDSYRLLAVDHPETTEIFTDERFAIPLPPLKIYTTGRRREFAAARNDRGEDVSETVRHLDENYLADFRRGKFQGVAREHFVEIELPADAPANGSIRLVADGFVHPTDASINVQRGQSVAAPPRGLSLETADANGSWRVAEENLGFPAGKMKTVLIELPAGARKFRLRTEMEIFWDRLAWAVDLPDNETRAHALDASAAELRYRGFSVIEKRDDDSPEKPVYERILTTGQRWRDLEGFYTRFGDVLELLAKTDDRIVLMNAGDELVLQFPALPEPPAGWRRDFVIVGNGWIKDGDLNSVFSKTLLPLPTHATNDYTRAPTRLEDDPVYRQNRADWRDYHTRYVAPDSFRNALRRK